MKDQEFYHIIEKYLSGEISSEEQSRLEAWLNHAPENQDLLDKMDEYWKLTGMMKPALSIDTENAYQTFKGNIGSKSSPTPIFGMVLKIAASILLLAVAGYFIFNITQKSQHTEFNTGDFTSEVVLPDGSKVVLNKNSSLKYPESFSGKTREVILIGEGFFEVENNPEQPFLVEAGSTTIKVLGTSFNIEAYEKSTTINVNVKTGKVGFYKAGERETMVTMLPGDHAIFNKQRNIITLEESANLNFLFWKDQILSFKDTPMDEVLQQLEKHYKTKFSIQNQEITNCTFTSTFTNPTLDEVLEVISLSLNLKFVQDQNGFTVNGKGCST